MKRSKARLIVAVTIWAAIFSPVSGQAIESASSPILEHGRLQADVAGGTLITDGSHHFGWDTSLRVGVADRLEIAAPAALVFRLAGSPTDGALYVGLGVVDLFVNSLGELLFEPSLVIGGYARFGPQASFRGTFDLSGAENGIRRQDHPYWFRGSIALVLDMGQVATLAFGLSYQRSVVAGEHPDGLDRTGWAGNSRVSFGSVKTQPVSDLPLFSVHLQDGLDFVILTRFDINVDARTTDIRCLLGFSLTIFSDAR